VENLNDQDSPGGAYIGEEPDSSPTSILKANVRSDPPEDSFTLTDIPAASEPPFSENDEQAYPTAVERATYPDVYPEQYAPQSAFAEYRPGGGVSDSPTVPATRIMRAAPATRRMSEKGKQSGRRRALLIGLVLVCFIVSFGGIYGAVTGSDALSAARDAKAQAQAIQGIIHGGHFTDTATLIALRGHLQALAIDLNRIQSDIPGGTSLVGGTAPGHALTMAQDLTTAGLYAVDAGLLIAPHIKDILGSVTGGSSGATKPQPAILTLSEIERASADVNAAGQYATAALVERAHVSDSALQSLGLGSLVHTLHSLDAISPKLPIYLAYGKTILAALPDLLGITKPVNYLLLDLDSDELRPSGGFQGVYGILTFSGARLSSGVHLQNIYTMDCPHGLAGCPFNGLPATYNWFTYHNGLRNANLDPNYPTTARLDERMLGIDHGPTVSGVISLTPLVIEQALKLTGPISVPGYPQKLTAQNFRELIHYYHDLIGQVQITKSKVFDAAAGGALLKAISHLSQSDQFKLIPTALADLHTGDLQVYFNDKHMQTTLAALKLDGALQTPAGDTFEVVNANHGANYANMDVNATESDHVVINAQGAATHTLTITYNFPVVNHRFPPNLVSVYLDDIQVLAPPKARLLEMRGCARIYVSEPSWADFACNMTLWRGSKATVVFQWVTPNVTQASAGGATQYNLLVQRQSGAHDALNVTISLPSGARPNQPLMAGLTLTAKGEARYVAALTEDRAISLAWTH
jgi:hypothetical protein